MTRNPVIYVAGILIAFMVTILLIVWVMNPPIGDLVSLGWLLAGTGLVSAGVGFISQRLGWWRQLRSINHALVLGYLMAAGLTLLNVLLAANQMFINQHDLALGSLLLIFASLISVAFGFFISSSVTRRLRDLADGAEALSQGNFAVRVSASGQDEVAQLSSSFNRMVARLETAKQAELALDEARRNLVAWASHDLRTPLASLRAMIDAMADGVVDDEETIRRYYLQSQSEIARMSDLIDDLFELAQIDAGHLELLAESSSLSDLISDTLESFTAQAQTKQIQLLGEIADGVDPVWMAPDKIGRVLNNLIGNALVHTRDEGRIEVSANRLENTVKIKIEDSGAGIADEDLPHIFDRFYRGEKSRSRDGGSQGGAGLGLAIAKGIVEAHGGDIGVSKTNSSGSTFWFSLPVMPHSG
jgi:signal transduction histidine kinase